jgi:hypothetical protein
VADISNAQEVVTTTSGGSVKRKSAAHAQHHPEERRQHARRQRLRVGTGGMVGSNYSPELQAAGLTTPARCSSSGTSPSAWAAHLKDRLWYRVAARDEGQHRRFRTSFRT